MKHADIIGRMTLEEKASMCSGKDFWHTQDVERVGIPSIMMCDGPHGLRKQDGSGDHVGMGGSVPATCFPTACTTASSWDKELLKEMGNAIAEEALKEKISMVLGPGTNIKRSPLCGRNFEYFSEDPYLAGELAASMIGAMQARGIGSSLKHFACNNQETRRMTISSVVDERTLREIYLTAFETAVKKSQPWCIMNSYNRLNGTYMAENKRLLTDILRNEWGFKGIVETDWGAEDDRAEGLKAGQELEMPSSNGLNDAKIVAAVKNGSLDESVLDQAVDRILDFIDKTQPALQTEHAYNEIQHNDLARKIASQSAVLMKNEDNILPLSKTAKIALIGDMAKTARYQGAGSSLINPTMLDSALETMNNMRLRVTYAQGDDKKSDVPNKELIKEACEVAKDADVAVLYVGLTDQYDSEGMDRAHMHIPQSHITLIEEVAKVQKNVVVVLSGGSAVEMPWIDEVKGLLNIYLGGQASGSASVRLLFGEVNPSGKLAESYPYKLSDTSCYNNFPGSEVTVEYRESVYVGYRYYDSANIDVRFPFGFGLSYTTFEYSDLQIDKTSMNDDEELTVTVKVKNTGKVDGAEVVELYVKDVESTIFRPEKELKGFEKIFLKAGEEKIVGFKLSKRAFAYYNVNIHDWHVESGEFKILIGASSRDIRLEGSVTVNSTQPDAAVPDYRETAPEYYKADVQNVPDKSFAAILGGPIPSSKRPDGYKFDLNSTIEDLRTTKGGEKLYKKICKLAMKVMKVEDEKDKSFQMMMATMCQTPLRSMIAMSRTCFSEKMAWGLIDCCTGHKAKGIGKLLSGLPHLLGNIKKLL